MPEPNVEGVRVFLASRNAKKLAELERILGSAVPGLQVLGLDDVPFYDEPVEDAPDFDGNALLKARAGFRSTGLPTIADDSGLCVAALNWMPGVLSARWSGQPKDDARNNALLLDQLADVPDPRRDAEFRCAIAFVSDGEEVVVHGVMRGRIADSVRGKGGFGYDVVFVPYEQDGDLTSAEMTSREKDQISHRGNALRALVPAVERVLLG